MHHFETGIKYELSPEAEDLFEEIIDNYNSQFNLKYSTSSSQITSSQPALDTSEREDIFVHTKAAELVGRVACVLSVYCNGTYFFNVFRYYFIIYISSYNINKQNFIITAFECVASGKSLHIPSVVSADYVRHAEEIVSTSYIQSEKFSSVSYIQVYYASIRHTLVNIQHN